MTTKIAFILVILTFHILQYGNAQLLGGSRTVGGCMCKESYELGGEYFEDCINPLWARAESPWCVVEESCETYRRVFQIGGQQVPVDLCDLGTEEEGALGYVTGIYEPPISSEYDTILGCQCKDRWKMRGQIYSGCANPNGDIFGDWCIVEESTCPVFIYIVARHIFGFSYLVDYCIEDDQDETPAQPPYTPAPPSVYQYLSPSPSPRPTPTAVPISIPSPPAAQDRPLTGDCISVLTVLNETEKLSRFNNIVLEGALQGTLAGQNDVTIFAPNNAAVDQFADDQNIDVSDFFLFKSNVAALKRVVQLHVVTELLSELDLQSSDGASFETLLGQNVQISVDGTEVLVVPPAEEAKPSTVLFEDGVVEVCEGLLYHVDTVLIPLVES
eukprot:TRINITY_DN5254_c0_g1_i1.p1 TRINITY_DN5254_c0_g1~~TRINITY_DN5254_c0_g1_i1.p1  ORF type:complete len:386 (-),score=37.22 TRINITY_DN5254_c0_g1_i1:218-1375(-)